VKDGLPTDEDFGDDPDSDCACEAIGGKTLEEAHQLCRETPEIFEEAFSSMGAEAFRFYYPVIDRYLRTFTKKLEGRDQSPTSANYLATTFGIRFACHHDLAGLHEPLLALCEYVATHPDYYATDEREIYEIGASWTYLAQLVGEHARGVGK
jgi:hypothetical protein